ncbi:MAG: hypothetical protein JWQ24_2154 [Tardiphaga sp.]|nr:hypothetical protein [Tardiphaga sp.]
MFSKNVDARHALGMTDERPSTRKTYSARFASLVNFFSTRSRFSLER